VNTFEARVDPNLERVWQWFLFQRELLNEAQSHLTAARGMPTRPYDKRFVGRSLADVDAFFETQRSERELLASFELVASMEAALRLDFIRRVQNKKKDRIARSFRSIETPDRPRLDDILDAWAVEASIRVGDFRGLLNFRDWLAHGRYWPPKLGRTYQAADAYRISTQLLVAIGTVPEGR
jgi:hypothetical protein